MAHTDDSFERLMSGSFTPEEASSFDKLLQGPAVRPLQPGRTELIEHFAAFEGQFRAARNDEQRESAFAKFFTLMARLDGLELSTPLQLSGVRSYLAGSSSRDIQYGLFETTAEVQGTFAGFNVECWYDVPEGQPMPDDADFTYFEEYGLYLCLEDARLVSPDVEIEYTGIITQIPLQHGSPELFRLYSAE